LPVRVEVMLVQTHIRPRETGDVATPNGVRNRLLRRMRCPVVKRVDRRS
jgi:hypothetical protein